MKILIFVEDKAVAGFIARGLQVEGFATLLRYDEEQAQEALVSDNFDVMIADCSTSEKIVRSARAKAPLTLILALTASDSLEKRIALLEAGADDCLPKPFSFVEMLARVRVLQRRRNPTALYEIRYKDLEVNRVTRSVRRDGKTIELTPKEYSLLEYLLMNAGRTVSRNMILEDVWRVHFDTMTNVVDVYINYLRKKVDIGFSEKLITTVRGMGYCIGEHSPAVTQAAN